MNRTPNFLSPFTHRARVAVAALLALAAVCTNISAAELVKEISGYPTIEALRKSARTNPIAARFVYGAKRDWSRRPFRLAVIPVEFSDLKHTNHHSAAFYDTLLFSKGKYLKTPTGDASFGSMADWYSAQSQGRFHLTGKVFDWVAVPDTFETIHGLTGKPARDRLLIAAMDMVKAREGLKNFDDFDGLIFFHAGPITGPAGNILWSHRADVAGMRYVITGEIERIGVICHEFGHVLGLPDLYPKKGVRDGFGPWCSMAGGYRGTYPKSFCVWSKARIGWCEPTVIDATATPQRVVLRPIQQHPNDAVIIPLNTTNGVGIEFLMLENRAAAGEDAEGQPGLFIWRIKRTPATGPFPAFDLRLPGPHDADPPQKDRRVAWPNGNARELVIPKDESVQLPVSVRNIRREGDLVFFEIGN